MWSLLFLEIFPERPRRRRSLKASLAIVSLGFQG